MEDFPCKDCICLPICNKVKEKGNTNGDCITLLMGKCSLLEEYLSVENYTTSMLLNSRQHGKNTESLVHWQRVIKLIEFMRW